MGLDPRALPWAGMTDAFGVWQTIYDLRFTIYAPVEYWNVGGGLTS